MSTPVRIAVVGDPGVGKSTLIQAILTGSFSSMIRPTTGLEISTKTLPPQVSPGSPVSPVSSGSPVSLVSPGTTPLILQFWDRGNVCPLGSDPLNHLKLAHLVLLCAAWNQPDLTAYLDGWLRRILAHVPPETPIGWVVTKTDLASPGSPCSPVTLERFPAFKFSLEISAKANPNLTQLLTECMKWIPIPAG